MPDNVHGEHDRGRDTRSRLRELALQLFAEPQVLRSVADDISSSYTPNLLAYTQAFTNNNPNYAAAVAVVLAVGTFILSFGFLRLVQRRGARMGV